MKFIKKLTSRLDTIDSHVCVGLDSRYDRIPEVLKKGNSISETIFAFNKELIQATKHVAIAYKVTLTFYNAFGVEGREGLRLTNHYLKSHYPEIPLIADYKTSDMGESAKMMKREIFEGYLFDCIMMTPWFGQDTVKEFLLDDKYGVAIYAHDSNSTAVEIQDIELKDGRKLYEVIAEKVAGQWNTNGNLFVEAAATYPEQLRRTRKIVGEDMIILTAGIGPQGGRLEDLKGVFGINSKRLLVNGSRSIIFAGEGKKDYFQGVKTAAEKFRNDIIKISLME